MMEIAIDVVMKNLGTFCNAYGIDGSSRKLAEDLINSDGYVRSIGILLRDPNTKKSLIACEFPVQGDYTEQMLWVPIDERPLEAVPIYTREKGAYSQLKNIWKSVADKLSEGNYYLVEEGELRLKVHHSFRKHGVIEKYLPADMFGFIRRNRGGIFFLKKWCNFEQVEEGKEVSFVPIISRRGLQARAVEEIVP